MAAKEAGAKKRAREKRDAKTQSEREDMALADEARRIFSTVFPIIVYLVPV